MNSSQTPLLSRTIKRIFVVTTAVALTVGRPASVEAQDAPQQPPRSVDLVIYGGTSSGIAAAVAAKRLGLSVIVIEPSDRVGGLTTGGLGQTDIGNKSAIGGIAREFYEDIATYYQSPNTHGTGSALTSTAAVANPRLPAANRRCGLSSQVPRRRSTNSGSNAIRYQWSMANASTALP
nr:FAD-dependent oxidoreductase [Rhodopirellula sp. MGV]